jgi:hypothetical protein
MFLLVVLVFVLIYFDHLSLHFCKCKKIIIQEIDILQKIFMEYNFFKAILFFLIFFIFIDVLSIFMMNR